MFNKLQNVLNSLGYKIFWIDKIEFFYTYIE